MPAPGDDTQEWLLIALKPESGPPKESRFADPLDADMVIEKQQNGELLGKKLAVVVSGRNDLEYVMNDLTIERTTAAKVVVWAWNLRERTAHEAESFLPVVYGKQTTTEAFDEAKVGASERTNLLAIAESAMQQRRQPKF